MAGRVVGAGGNMNAPRLFILNQMAGPITWELAVDLADRLGQVTLLTGHPDTLQKDHPRVTLVPAPIYHRGSLARRALSWLHYWFHALVWLLRQPRQVPLLLFSNPPLLAWLGFLLRRFQGRPYAVMVHDIYPDALARLKGWSEWHPIVALWRRLNRAAYEGATAVMTLGEEMAANLARQFDPSQTPAGEISLIYPWADTSWIRPLPKGDNWFAREQGQVHKLTVMYSGNMGLGHDIETMLAAALALRDEPDIHFLFVGAGPKWSLVERALQAHQLPNVTLLGWQEEAVIPFSLATADVALISLEPEIEGLAVPSKSVYALAAGSALLLLAGPENGLRQWIEKHRCGAVVPPGDAAALVARLRAWLAAPEELAALRARARRAATTTFDRAANSAAVAARIRPMLDRVQSASPGERPSVEAIVHE